MKTSTDLKIIVVGNSGTGKTSFVHKWTRNQFQENYKATIVSEFGYKIYEHKNKIYRIQVWDLAGQDKNTTMTKVFCKDSHGVIILSDITNSSTLQATLNWKKSIDENVTFFDKTPLPMMLIQNKADLLYLNKNEDENLENKEYYTPSSEIQSFSESNGFNFVYNVSVKEGVNINESMNQFLNLVIEKTENLKFSKKLVESTEGSEKEVKKSIILSPSSNSNSKGSNNLDEKNKCCK